MKDHVFNEIKELNVMNKLLTKVKRKLGGILSTIVPYNQSLRPKGFVESSFDYFTKKNSPGNYKKIVDGYDYHLELPADLRDAAELFEKVEDSVVLPDIAVVNVPNGRLYTDAYNTVAVITEDNLLLLDISLEIRRKEEIAPFINHIFKIRYFVKPEKVDGTVFTLLTGGGGLDNYFHWLFDVLPRLYLLQASGFRKNINWYLVPNYMFPYQIDTLNLLGIKKDMIIDGTKHLHLQADNIIASSPHRNGGQMENWACDFLRSAFISKVKQGDALPEFIYITRNDSKSRNVTNEPELIRLLETYGFKTVSLAGLSFVEQVRLFNNARVIVSPHGAGLANLVFCNPGTKIVEIFSEGWIGTMYWDLATKLSLAYYYHIAKVSRPPKTAGEAKHKHFEVDVKVIDDFVRTFFDQGNSKTQ